MEKTRLKNVSLKDIEISNGYWDKYIRLVKNIILPYQWDILSDNLEVGETSHCIENFKIAAGLKKGEFRGAVFQDTDLAKWLEAVAYTLAVHPDEALEKLADDTISLIGKAQQKDGYLNTYFTIKEPELRFTNLKEGHELYTAGHMIEAAVAYYEATGKKELLEIVCRMADLITQTFGPEEHQLHGYPGHQEIELALVKLYNITGNTCYLETAKYFIDTRGSGENYFLREEKSPKYKPIFPVLKNYDPIYSQSHIPVRQQKTAEGHAVRAVYMYCAMADLAYEYQDQELFDACVTLWKNMIEKRMYLTGGIGSSGILERFTTDYDLPNDSAYSETCASIGLALFGKRMSEITHDASYMDVVERALYNGILSGIALDGKSFFYVNPLEVWPENCLDRTSMEHVKPHRQKWFGVACCPPNIARTLASLGQYIYFTDADTVYVNLYIGGRVSLLPDGKTEIKLEVETEFPYESRIRLKISSEDAFYGKFAFRIPDYTKSFLLFENGEEIQYEIKKGYAVIEGSYRERRLEIQMEMPPRFMHSNPKVRENAGKVAIVKGPLVYCLEECDNGSNLAGIYVDTKGELIEQYEPELLGGVLTISGFGQRITEENWREGELYKERELQVEAVQWKAVPYGNWCNRKPGEMMVWMKEYLH